MKFIVVYVIATNAIKRLKLFNTGKQLTRAFMENRNYDKMRIFNNKSLIINKILKLF
jgi:hypothetical protein